MIRTICNWFKAKPHVEVFDGIDAWHVRIRAINGEIMLSSEGYSTRSNAIRAAQNIATAFGLEIKVDPIHPTLET